MRLSLIVLPLAMMATPAIGAGPERIEIPKEISDPATTDRLVRMMQAMSEAFLALPVGEIEAAAEGRPATPADKARTVGSESRMTGQQLRAELEANKPMLQASMKALVRALPAMMKGLNEAGRELEKARANMPSPNYPKR